MINRETWLFVVAHPDDEILGCAGTIRRLKEDGKRVVILTMSTNSATRESGLSEVGRKTHKILGVDRSIYYNYEMMKFGTYDRYELTQVVEKALKEENAHVVVTHFLNDIHNDHRVLSQIVMEACKLPFRRTGVDNCALQIYQTEIPSSTDWGAGFEPNAFFEISESDITLKAELLKYYEGVIRDIPHPRNYESFKALARYRGGQCGVAYAEAYRKAFEVNKNV